MPDDAAALERFSTYEAIAHWAKVQPTKPAIIDHDRVLSYRDFHAAVERLADVFAADRPIHAAVIALPALCDAWVVSLALRQIGATTIAVDELSMIERLDLPPQDCIVCTDDAEARATAARLAKDALIVTGLPAANPAPVARPGRERSPGHGAHILLTSGTTGDYKKVVLDQPAEWRWNGLRAEHFRLTRDTVHHGMQYGLWTGVGFKHSAATWWRGGTVVFDSRPERFFNHGVNTTALTAADLRRVIDARPTDAPPPAPWRLMFGGGFLAAALADQARDRLNCEIDITLGATELAGCLLQATYRSPEDLHWFTRLPNRTITVRDAHGAVGPIGVEGELAIDLLPFDCQGYLDNPAATARVFRGGRFYTGDMAVEREDGRIRVLGRTADVVNLSGRKVAVRPIEAFVQAAVGAREVCIFAGLTDGGVEEVVIALEMDAPPSSPALQSVARRFPEFGKARFVGFPSFPRGPNGMGKVDRTALRKMLGP